MLKFSVIYADEEHVYGAGALLGQAEAGALHVCHASLPYPGLTTRPCLGSRNRLLLPGRAVGWPTGVADGRTTAPHPRNSARASDTKQRNRHQRVAAQEGVTTHSIP